MPVWKSEEVLAQIRELKIVDEITLDKTWKESQLKKLVFEDLVVNRGLISEANLGRVIADLLKVSFIELRVTPINHQILKTIPYEFAKSNGVIVFKNDESGWHVAMINPENKKLVRLLEKRFETPIVIYLTVKSDIEDALSRYYQNIQDLLEKLIKTDKNPANKILTLLVSTAYKSQASDIHLEPQLKSSLIRFRSEGQLLDVATIPIVWQEKLLEIIKTKTDQTGKMVFSLAGEVENIELVATIAPVLDGEKCVLEFLTSQARKMSLIDLGFNVNDLDKLRAAYQKPAGIILIEGQANSGKTATLYALLKVLNSREVNIATIEDPIEYRIEGISQIELKELKALNMAQGLELVLRQDPNIVLVGDISDTETAKLVLNGALTGHLILTTILANEDSSGLAKLLKMGLEPFLLGNALNVIVTQKLVRKICFNCREKREINQAILDQYHVIAKNQSFYYGKGCELCQKSGYRGRIGVFEVMQIEGKVREAIQTGKTAKEVYKIAVLNGMTTLWDDGMAKVHQGLATIEEIIRISQK